MTATQHQAFHSQTQADAAAVAVTDGVVSRRRFLGGVGGLMAAMAADGWLPGMVWAQAQTGAAGPMFAYVGCYTTEKRHGHGKGINVYRMDPASGNWSHVQLVEDLVNPSFLALDRRKRFLYSVHGDMTYATAFAIDAPTGRLTQLNQQALGGGESCTSGGRSQQPFSRGLELQLGVGGGPAD